MRRELHYRWEFDLKATPEKLWPFISDTNRFNRDTGVPSVEPAGNKRQRLRNARRRLRLSIYGMAVEWEEQPFEWVRPTRFGVARNYSKGPMVQLRALAELTPTKAGGTRLIYSVSIQPRSQFSSLMVALQMKFISGRRFAEVFHNYDRMACEQTPVSTTDTEVELSAAELDRLHSISERLIADGADPEVVSKLCDFVRRADEFAAARIRPYELADEWKMARRAVLETFLRATRVGLLDLQWELLCPLCRGAQETGSSLKEISSHLHC